MSGWTAWTAWRWQPKGSMLAVGLLCWVFFSHLSGVYLFTSGFLLNRLALSNSSNCPNGSCTLPATHNRAVVLIIDALRFDFISPDPPTPHSPFHHNVLTLPRQLTEKHPSHSFIYHAYADPPTTTMQRIKGITTGSLPTFVDISSNFGGSSIEEDSLIKQLSQAGKKVCIVSVYLRVFFYEIRSVGRIHGRRYLDDRFSKFVRTEYDLSVRLFQCRRFTHRR